MRAMILAAGRGERMRELTRDTPKALLIIDGNFLIEYSLRALAKANIKEVVINVCYCADQIKEVVGDGRRYGLSIQYSEEEVALETGGGILKALPLLGDDPFIVLSCDIVSNFDLTVLPKQPQGLAHLVLVENPIFKKEGDFCIRDNLLYLGNDKTFTFANIGVYRRELFHDIKEKQFPLGPLLKKVVSESRITGEVFKGFWENLGTPEQLESTARILEVMSL